MDFLKNIEANLPLIIGAIALLVLQYFLRKRRGPEANQKDIVQDLAAEVRLDVRLADIFPLDYRAKPFMTTTWQLNKDKLEFLGPKLVETINSTFTMAVDVNHQIAEAKKHKSNAYMSNIDIEKLKKALNAAKEGLEQWLLLKVGSRNPPVKNRGMFDDLLGKR